MTDKTAEIERKIVGNALMQSWQEGYQQAVDTLREMAKEAKDENMRRVLLAVAEALQECKP